MVLNKVVENNGNFGFNAQTAEYGNLLEMGVVDPTKVARSALQYAASVAGLILTTDAMVAELPREEKHTHGGRLVWTWICDRMMPVKNTAAAGFFVYLSTVTDCQR